MAVAKFGKNGIRPETVKPGQRFGARIVISVQTRATEVIVLDGNVSPVWGGSYHVETAHIPTVTLKCDCGNLSTIDLYGFCHRIPLVCHAHKWFGESVTDAA